MRKKSLCNPSGITETLSHSDLSVNLYALPIIAGNKPHIGLPCVYGDFLKISVLILGIVTGMIEPCCFSPLDLDHLPAGYVISVGNVRGSGSTTRSEERRVGKECRSRWSPYH